MRTPITYYGGKQSLLKYILPNLWKDHDVYVEPFIGGGAVYFAKEASKLEVINDLNNNMVNFYQCIKEHYEELNTKIQSTLCSEAVLTQANIIYNNPFLFDSVTRAWAVFALSALSFGSCLRYKASFGYEIRLNKRTHALGTKKECFTELEHRLENTFIFSRDAVDIVKLYGVNERAIFYLDPPYVGADQGHYKGYTQDAFDNLLEALHNIKGHFLLSSYDNDKLTEYVKLYGWKQKHLDCQNFMSAHGHNMVKTRKVEVLTANYDLV